MYICSLEAESVYLKCLLFYLHFLNEDCFDDFLNFYCFFRVAEDAKFVQQGGIGLEFEVIRTLFDFLQSLIVGFYLSANSSATFKTTSDTEIRKSLDSK